MLENEHSNDLGTSSVARSLGTAQDCAGIIKVWRRAICRSHCELTEGRVMGEPDEHSAGSREEPPWCGPTHERIPGEAAVPARHGDVLEAEAASLAYLTLMFFSAG